MTVKKIIEHTMYEILSIMNKNVIDCPGGTWTITKITSFISSG